ncbi:HAMP domain-containing protein [Phytoactinopolyspora halotolerans]|uniref:histidine kinase n=1 Tax=Phytoactinopolyspora halotolerans TaxID=1981512 RepID=A0A6L9SJI1_9ACTN|nr:HAMP domain-containing protein [Phytoactinopolyspora halotolerans]
MRSRLSLRTRVGALAALCVGVAVALTALAVYLTVSTQLVRSVDESLYKRASDTLASSLGPSSLVQIPSEAFLASDTRVAYMGSNSELILPRGEESALPVGEPELAVAQGREDHHIRTADLKGENYRMLSVRASDRFALVVGQSMAQSEWILDRVRIVSLLVGGIGVVGATWAGLSVAQAGLRPVRRLTEAAEHVARTQRLDPIEVEGKDEIARLAYSFNEMLSALNDARARQARLVADAGHELRTPLTSMRTNLDLLAQSDREGDRLPPADRAQIIDDVRAQAEELSQLMGDLVELSREDPPRESREQLDFADVVRDALTRVRRRAPSVTFTADLRPWNVHGDPHVIGRAVTNLLDNAAKYSPSDGTVTVRLHSGTLEVDDEGPGIADEDLPHVFERFYRSSEARGRPGSGLGLAIVRTAAERHDGRVSAGRAPSGGARLTMYLPGSPPPTEAEPPSSASLA